MARFTFLSVSVRTHIPIPKVSRLVTGVQCEGPHMGDERAWPRTRWGPGGGVDAIEHMAIYQGGAR